MNKIQRHVIYIKKCKSCKYKPLLYLFCDHPKVRDGGNSVDRGRHKLSVPLIYAIPICKGDLQE